MVGLFDLCLSIVGHGFAWLRKKVTPFSLLENKILKILNKMPTLFNITVAAILY